MKGQGITKDMRIMISKPDRERIMALTERFGKFIMIGGFVFCVQTFLTWLFKRKLSLGDFLSLSLAYVISAATHFALNNAFTFKASKAGYSRRVVGYIIVIVTNYFITTLAGSFILGHIADNILISNILTTGMTTLYSFIVLSKVVYKIEVKK